MTKWILAGALFTLAIIKLADMNQTNPEIGIPVTIALVGLWLTQLAKDLNAGRK
jgi:hypothetical protein